MESRYRHEAELREYIDRIFKVDMEVFYNPTEVLGEAAILKYQLQYQNKKLILYGAGKIGFVTLIWLKKVGIKPEFIVDSDEKKRGTDLLGVPVVHLYDLKQKLESPSSYIMLITAALGTQGNDVKRKLFQAGIVEIKDVHYQDFHSNMDNSELDIYKAYPSFMEVFEKLEDMESKEVMCEMLRCRLYDDFYRLEHEPCNEKYWGSGIFENIEQESLLCLGGSNGDTLFYFLEKYKNFDRIFCFEPENMKWLKNNLEILPSWIRDKIKLEEYYVADYTVKKTIQIDDWIGDEKISLVTMDIEGMEINALEGAKKTIKKHQPILALSAYHKWDDLIVFTNWIANVFEEYRFYLRKYGARLVNSRNEIVLYAVPSKRLIG